LQQRIAIAVDPLIRIAEISVGRRWFGHAGPGG
jgi:hypothetical protein